MAESFNDLIEKFNPYHDRLGRFASAGNAASVTIRTRSKLWQGANDKAIERAKQQHERTMPTAAQEKTLKGIETKTRNLKKEQFRVVDRDGNVILTKQGDKHSVEYKVGEARDTFPGNITIHNHPSGGTFSTADLSDIGYGASEIRAASPEGTYILRNIRTGQKWVDGQKTWYEMREDLTSASESFKSGRQLKKDIKQKHQTEAAELQKIAEKWSTRKDSGASDEELSQYISEYNKRNDALKATIETEVRTAYTNQYHEWYKSNSMNYGMEYVFNPVRSRTSKSYYEEEIVMIGKSDGDVILDKEMNDNITQMTEEIMNSLTEEKMAKSFSELVEKFNPYHDRLGRFASAGSAASFTIRTKDPKKQHMADMAVAREKERNANPAGKYGLTKDEADDLINNSGPVSFNQKAKEMGWDAEKRSKFKEEFKVAEKWKERAQRKVDEEKARQEQERRELDERVKDELPGLNQDAIRRANDVSFFEHGSVAARNALRRVDDYRERNKIDDNMTDEQKDYLKRREEEYKQLVTEYYNDSNSRFANNPSWAVAGPANFNVRRSDKLNNAAQRKAQEYEEKLSRFEQNTKKQLERMQPEEQQISRWRQGKWKHGETISNDDPLAEKKLAAKLEYHQEQQQKMKDANAYYRRNGSMKGFEGFSEKTNENIDAAIANNSWEKKPFASYQLTNNNASIKSTQSRLTEIRNRQQKATETGGAGGGTKFDGGEVVRNTGINRLQIKFDSIPDAAMRQKLKSSGWRWSPKEGAWQRQLTDNAERSASSILGLSKSYSEDDTFEIQKTDDDKRLVFGWANVATRANGEVIQDWQDDIVDPEDLEEAVYEYVLNFRDGGEEHLPGLRKKCRMVESVVFTDEKLEAMGIPKGTVPLGWWIGFYVDDNEAWKKIKSGHYKMFSVEGNGRRVPVEDLPTKLAKTFKEMV